MERAARRLFLIVIAYLTVTVGATYAQAPSPSPSASGPAPSADPSGAPTQCVRPVTCLTAEMLPVGTPIKVSIDAWISPKMNEHAAAGEASMLPAEDVVLNGRLIVLKGRPGTFTFLTVAAAPYCSSITAAAVWIHTQDWQVLPVSFADPRTGAPNSFTFPMSFSGLECRRSGVPATVYISGPPSLNLPHR